jgi:enolase
VGGVSANTLPVPMMNIINGGLILMHQSHFRIYDFSSKSDFTHAMQMGTEIFTVLKKVLHDRGLVQQLVMKVVLRLLSWWNRRQILSKSC